MNRKLQHALYVLTTGIDCAILLCLLSIICFLFTDGFVLHKLNTVFISCRSVSQPVLYLYIFLCVRLHALSHVNTLISRSLALNVKRLLLYERSAALLLAFGITAGIVLIYLYKTEPLHGFHGTYWEDEHETTRKEQTESRLFLNREDFEQVFFDGEWIQAEWQSSVYLDADDQYTFLLTSDEPSQLYVDDIQIAASDAEKSSVRFNHTAELSRGWHSIRVLYHQTQGNSFVHFQLRQFKRIILQPWRFSPIPVSAASQWRFSLPGLLLRQGAILVLGLSIIALFSRMILRFRQWRAITVLLVRSPRTYLVLLCTLAFLCYGRYRVTTVGAADSYGYLELSTRLLHRTLIVQEPLIGVLRLPSYAIYLMWPLGTFALPGTHATAPGYPPGYPILLALGRLLAGDTSISWISPLLGVGLLFLIYAVGKRVFDETTGVLAAALFFALPLSSYGATQIMSDTSNVFMIWLGIYLLISKTSWIRLFGAGVISGFVVWIRPTSILFVPVFAVCFLEYHGFRLKKVSMVITGLVLMMSGLLLYQWSLYGHPLRTGYGDMHIFFSFTNIPERLFHYLFKAQSFFMPVLLIFSLPGIARVLAKGRLFLLLPFPLFLGFYATYEFYTPWWNERFLLPALPALVFLSVLGINSMLHRIRLSELKICAVWGLLLIPLALIWSYNFLNERDFFEFHRLESSYERIGAWVAQNTEPNAVFFTWIHSGALRHYGKRQTIRWDIGEPQELETIIKACINNELPIYLLEQEPSIPKALHRMQIPMKKVWYRDQTYLYKFEGSAQK